MNFEDFLNTIDEDKQETNISDINYDKEIDIEIEEKGDQWIMSLDDKISQWLFNIPKWSYLLKEVDTYFLLNQTNENYIDRVMIIFDNINTSIDTTIKKVKNEIDDDKIIIKNNMLKNLNTQKQMNINKFKEKLGQYSPKDLKNTNTFIEHQQKLYKLIIKDEDIVEYMIEIFNKNRKIKIDKLLLEQEDNPIEYYKGSLKLANEYIHRRRNDPNATNEIDTIQGDAFEEHRKRIWEFFHFTVKGNEKQHVKEYLGGYDIDQFIFWDDKLIALEEDKSRKIDKGGLEKVMVGMAKTIYHYQNYKNTKTTEKDPAWKKSSFTSPDFLYKGKMPHIIIHTFTKYGILEKEAKNVLKVFKKEVKDAFIMEGSNKNFHYTRLIDHSGSNWTRKKKTWFYKPLEDDYMIGPYTEYDSIEYVQPFFAAESDGGHADIQYIIKDIKDIISIIPLKKDKDKWLEKL